jgi:hypothetical protein
MPKISKALSAFRKKCRDAHKTWSALADDCNPEMLRIGDHGKELFWDLAIIGIGRQHGSPYVFIYDEAALTNSYATHLMLEEGLDAEAAYEQASEWVSFNVVDAYLGPNTPIIRITHG